MGFGTSLDTIGPDLSVWHVLFSDYYPKCINRTVAETGCFDHFCVLFSEVEHVHYVKSQQSASSLSVTHGNPTDVLMCLPC